MQSAQHAVSERVVPIFLLSLPRSGSTLVQRVLGSHPEIATTSEPWLMLPFLSPIRPVPAISDGWQRTTSGALHDFTARLRGGEAEYLAAIEDTALRLYSRSGQAGARYFLDKTPPYHLIVEQLLRTFPRARFVILWRNPLSVLASIVSTQCGGRWDTQRHRGDLFHGVANLVAARMRHGDRIHAVRYEDLLLDGGSSWRALMEHLEVPFDPSALERFHRVALAGRMGDPTGVRDYVTLSREPLEKWRATISNPVRVVWSERYVRWIGRERLSVMGYDLDTLLSELHSAPTSWRGAPADVMEVGLSIVREVVRRRIADDHLISVWRSLLGPLPR